MLMYVCLFNLDEMNSIVSILNLFSSFSIVLDVSVASELRPHVESGPLTGQLDVSFVVYD